MNYRIMTIHLLVFLAIIAHCSATLGAGIPAKATLSVPINVTTETKPAYIWLMVPSATWYYLWVNDASGKVIVKKWYDGNSVCYNNYGYCGLIATTDLKPGIYKWWIQTWNDTGYGPWSKAGSFAVSVPWIAVPGIPANTTTDTKPVYLWLEVPSAIWYCLKVNDASGKTVVKKWYKAEEQVCSSAYGICGVIEPTALKPGIYKWWLQTWNDAGYGPWSDPVSFAVSVPWKTTLGVPISRMYVSTTPAYLWKATPQATWYYLWVNNSSDQAIIQKWYKVGQVCNSANGICGVASPAALTAGVYKWWIQTWNEAGYGPWSDAGSFVVSASGNSTLYENTKEQTTQTWICESLCETNNPKEYVSQICGTASGSVYDECKKGVERDNERIDIDRNVCKKGCK